MCHVYATSAEMNHLVTLIITIFLKMSIFLKEIRLLPNLNDIRMKDEIEFQTQQSLKWIDTETMHMLVVVRNQRLLNWIYFQGLQSFLNSVEVSRSMQQIKPFLQM